MHELSLFTIEWPPWLLRIGTIINFIYIFPTALSMASKAITAGVGIPMIVVGALMAWLWAPTSADLQNQVELVGSTIGILGVVFFISGLFYSKEPVMH